MQPDNKIRMSQDVLDKANVIAREWGLKNARAAIEAVFRRYSDDYMQSSNGTITLQPHTDYRVPTRALPALPPANNSGQGEVSKCEAMGELDDLLGM